VTSYLWKAAAIFLPEIATLGAVLGMAESLCTFAKEKGVKKAERTSWVIKDTLVSGLE
jgi:hypothetical protein